MTPRVEATDTLEFMAEEVEQCEEQLVRLTTNLSGHSLTPRLRERFPQEWPGVAVTPLAGRPTV